MRPKHIVLFIGVCLLLLGLICYFFPQSQAPYGLHFPSLSEVLELHEDTLATLDAPAPIDTLTFLDTSTLDTLNSLAPTENVSTETTTIAATSTATPKPQPQPATTKAPQASSSVTPANDPLALFRAGLAEASSRQVRVIHYGDSQIEEDRISNNIRRHLQALYGGSGAGWVQVPQNVPSKTTKMTVTMNDKLVTRKTGPVRYTVFGRQSDHRPYGNQYNASGYVSIMDSTIRKGSELLLIHIEPLGEVTTANCFSQIRVLKKGDIEVNGLDQDLLLYPDSTTQCDIELFGQGDLYGLSLESSVGVLVDNVPMRGAIGNTFTKMDSAQMADYYRLTNTRLIILQFGGNVMPGTQSTNRIYGYVKNMRKQIALLRQCAPNASIMFVGPSDMLTTIDGERTSYPYLSLLDNQLAKMAAEEGVGYFSLYQAMGGKGGMKQWQSSGLAAGDGVHFTHKGANRAGELLWEWIEKELKK